MTDNFNPYQPPKTSATETKRNKTLTFLDWVFGITLGILALIVTFFSTCVGVVLSFLASDLEMLAPAVSCFCFLFAIGVGYSAVANYLARKARQVDGSALWVRSFQLQSSYRRPTKLDELLAGSGTGLLALIALLPTTYFFTDQLNEMMHFSADTSESTQLIGHGISFSLSLIIGWWYWRRASSR